MRFQSLALLTLLAAAAAEVISVGFLEMNSIYRLCRQTITQRSIHRIP